MIDPDRTADPGHGTGPVLRADRTPDVAAPRPVVAPATGTAHPPVGRLLGRVRDYAWGSRTAIAELQGRPSPTMDPEAELWFGAHPTLPAWLQRPGSDVREPLDAVIAADPASELGVEVLRHLGPRLPFLVKLLAADRPLSLQAHPDEVLARRGFATEEAAGIAHDAPERCYRDEFAKPELLHALAPVELLCGFRSVPATVALLDDLGVLAQARARLVADGEAALAPLVRDLLGTPAGDDGMRRLVAEVTRAAQEHASAAAPTSASTDGPSDARATSPSGASAAAPTPSVGDPRNGHAALELHPPLLAGPGVRPADHRRVAAWVAALGAAYPADPGVVVALLLGLWQLEPGASVHVPPGTLHAYLTGVGIEVMAASDNVLRAGLTTKHVAVAELLRAIDTEVTASPEVSGSTITGSARRFAVPAPEFQLDRHHVDRPLTLPPLPAPGPQILVVLATPVAVEVDGAEVLVAPGDAAYVSARASGVALHPHGDQPAVVFRVTVGQLATAPSPR